MSNRDKNMLRISFSSLLEALANGVNVAVVFRVKKRKPLPETFMGYQVIDGDLTDLRFTDGKAQDGRAAYPTVRTSARHLRKSRRRSCLSIAECGSKVPCSQGRSGIAT
jgi:hypothetical protein